MKNKHIILLCFEKLLAKCLLGSPIVAVMVFASTVQAQQTLASFNFNAGSLAPSYSAAGVTVSNFTPRGGAVLVNDRVETSSPTMQFGGSRPDDFVWSGSSPHLARASYFDITFASNFNGTISGLEIDSLGGWAFRSGDGFTFVSTLFANAIWDRPDGGFDYSGTVREMNVPRMVSFNLVDDRPGVGYRNAQFNSLAGKTVRIELINYLDKVGGGTLNPISQALIYDNVRLIGAVPEASSAILCLTAGCSFMLRRKR